MAGATPSDQTDPYFYQFLPRTLCFISLFSAITLFVNYLLSAAKNTLLPVSVAATSLLLLLLLNYRFQQTKQHFGSISLVFFGLCWIISCFSLTDSSLIPPLLLIICLVCCLEQFPLQFWLLLPVIIFLPPLLKALLFTTINTSFNPKPLTFTNQILILISLSSLAWQLTLTFKKKLEKIYHCHHLIQLGQTSRILAHEINNSIMAILCSASQLNQFCNTKKQCKLQQEIEEAAVIAKQIIDCHHHPNMPGQTFYLNQILVKVIKTLDFRAQQKNIKIRSYYQGKMKCRLIGPACYLYQILNNLITNSIEAYPCSKTDCRTKTKRVIRVYTWRKRTKLLIKIEDNGKGIAPEDRPFIFNPFFSTKQNCQMNLGLGLTICQHLIKDRLAGTLKVRSQPQQGTSILISLPIYDS